MLARPNVVADFNAAGTFFAKSVAQSSLPLPSPCKCKAYLPWATCWVCTASVPPFEDASHFAGSMLPLSKSSQMRPGHAGAPAAPPSVDDEPPLAPPPACPAVPACVPPAPAKGTDDPPLPPLPPCPP